MSQPAIRWVLGGGFVKGLYRAANKIHINTNESYIRGDLLFEEGDCYDPFLIEESGRKLRAGASTWPLRGPRTGKCWRTALNSGPLGS